MTLQVQSLLRQGPNCSHASIASQNAGSNREDLPCDLVDPFACKTQRAILSIAAAIVAVTMGADAPGAEEAAQRSRPRRGRRLHRSSRD